jgi:hypothetical protein
MEKGLNEHEDVTARILLEIIRFQLRTGYSGSRIFLASFGGPHDDLAHDPAVLSIRSIDSSLPLARQLCKLAGKDPVPGEKGAVLKIGRSTIDDLLVIFRSGLPIFMEKPMRTRYMSMFKKHTLWVTIEQTQVTVEVGKIPEEWNKPQMPDT